MRVYSSTEDQFSLTLFDRGLADFTSGAYATGCDLHDDCFSCPLPACRYELPPGQARAQLQAATLGELLSAGRTMDEAAMVLGVARRTAYRLRAQYLRRDGLPPSGHQPARRTIDDLSPRERGIIAAMARAGSPSDAALAHGYGISVGDVRRLAREGWDARHHGAAR